MPNFIHCTLLMKGQKQDIQKVKASISSTDETRKTIPFDFNKVIPMPKELDISLHSDAELLYKRDYLLKPLANFEYKRLRELTSEELSSMSILAEQYHNNKQKYGHIAWYSWSVKNWGTKWNASFDEYELKKSKGNVIHFTTAWDPPIPVLNTLACLYPNISFTLEYFDGQNPDKVVTTEFHIGEPPFI